MRSKNQSNTAASSFIETARRTQIIECAIDVIAQLGYGQASLAQIAKRLNISKGVISYHFKSKDELIRQVILEVIHARSDFVQPRLDAETTASAKLERYIRLSIDFIRTSPTQLQALVEIFTNFRTKEGKLHIDLIANERPRAALEAILEEGLRQGEFRPFSISVMAIAIQASINGILAQWIAIGQVDLDEFEEELVTLFAAATRHPALPSAQGVEPR